jgi:Bifunctional DNA primase/polymerase, N-terminal
VTLFNGELSQAAPFGSGAHKYLQAGWPVFPLPQRPKFPPPAEVTGWRGRDLTPEEVEDLQRRHGTRNIGIRMPTGAIGIDVDAYGGKAGSRTLSALEAELGPLPDAPILTSRDDGISGIRVFRLPGDEVLQGVMGPGIEVIQRHHRYAVAAPSAHPKNKDPYRWLNPDRSEAMHIPRVADLPPLPQSWVDRFRAVPRSPGGPVASSGMVQVWLSARDAYEACPRIVTTLEELVANEGSRHDSVDHRQPWRDGTSRGIRRTRATAVVVHCGHRG